MVVKIILQKEELEETITIIGLTVVQWFLKLLITDRIERKGNLVKL